MAAPILVLGAGVSGLSCAVRLLEHGHRVRVLSDRRTPATTSDRSAAAFTPFRVEGDERCERWTRTGYESFAAIAREQPESGARLGRMFEHLHQRLDASSWWADLVDDYRRLDPPHGDFADGFVATLPLIDMTRYMPWLERRVAELGGRIEHGRAPDIDELFGTDVRVVVNTTGLGARELCDDHALVPMRGQVVHAPNDLGLADAIVDPGTGDDATELAYVFSFEDHLVLGGTFERGVEAETPEPEVLDAIVTRCRALLAAHGISGAERLASRRLRELAGLRPSRVARGCEESVRLEREDRGGGRHVVHDYGHGRAGVTLSWGCAGDVARLVGEVYST